MDFSSIDVEKFTTPPEIPVEYLTPDFIISKILTVYNAIFNPFVGSIIKGILGVVALFFITLLSYCSVRMLEIREKEGKHLKSELERFAKAEEERTQKEREKRGGPLAERWRFVVENVLSPNSSDWKLAIIEADSMLEYLLDQLGYKGENLGEKLKMVNEERFHTLNQAWEAHIVRNKIAHEGMQFELSQHEAKRVAALYEMIFREFGYI